MKAKDGDNRINFKGRVIIIIVAVALVIAAGYYYWDTISVYFGRLFSGDTAKELTYAGYSNSSYAGINGGIAVASTRGIQVIDGNGEQKVNDSFEMKSPAVKVEGDFGIAFDIGGNTAKVFDESSIKYKVES